MQTVPNGMWEPIDLAWRHMMAAYWAITWPAGLAMFLLLAVIPSAWLLADPTHYAVLIGLTANLVFFFGQTLLVPRIVGKRYRSFRIDLISGGASSRRLPVYEAALVAIRILGPQVVFVAAAALVVHAVSQHLEPLPAHGVSSLFLWMRLVFVGPYSVLFAVSRPYPGFRLQAYGWRFV